MVPKNFPTINISKFSEIDALVNYFQTHPKEYDSVVESWIEDNLESSVFTEYYQRRMRRAIDSFIPINNHCYMLGKRPKVQSKVAKLMSMKERLEQNLNLTRHKQAQSKYRILRLHQPIASMLVSGLTKEMKAVGLPELHEGETIFVYAEEATKNSIRGFRTNESIYGTYHNALVMGAIKDAEYLPKDCFVGLVKAGRNIANGVYGVKEAFAFEKHVKELWYGIDSSKYLKANIPEMTFDNGLLRVPLNNELWEQMERLEGHIYLYWKSDFDNFFSLKYGLGNEEGLYDIIFVHGVDEKRFKQNDIGAVTKQEFVNSSDDRVFWALIINFEKLSLKKKYEDSSFSILRKQEWILDWKCVKFKNGYFVVVPPVDESIKFKPQAFSKPGVIESYNYLKEYLNDRLAPVRCSVEEMKLTIYDSIRLDEAIAKFATVSRQRAIKSTGQSNTIRIAPQQMSFKQALSKAQQMTKEEFEKYKSEYINHLVKLQSKKYKVIPCVERLSHANSDVTEYAFMFSIECRSGNILIVHENVNPDRSTLLFWVKEDVYDKAIREIYDFLQSAEINKRSSLRGKGIDVGKAGVVRYKSINHDDIWSWRKAIRDYTVGYYVNI
jgi:hypothetical protein